MTTTATTAREREPAMPGNEPLLQIRDLTIRYGNHTAVDRLNLNLPAGQIVGLLGENGCGKSTLLKALAGVYADYTGEISLGGHSPGPQSKAITSYLPDRSALPDRVRVSYCLDLYGDFFADFDRAKAGDLLDFFGLPESMRLKEMSKGMREKVQITLAMARQARVYLLDEPISGVDPAARQGILDGILRNLNEDSLLLIATHLIHDLEATLDSVVMMRRGKVLLTGQVDDLRAEHQASLDQLFRKVYGS
ncbi:ABC transporter ATP-binding protein [Ruania halotolerans]|uniref:ABC transporter ATP-binding protein n=1 Tax=Ruania halotolerans TaxID=2897773 RepID=UPI001E47DB3E|nr:ABC transporter ATP-binding protein [Ruania halotolerans]UFU06111.1 ABC transporter ATP-binding protein [Ruania halotolerans]